MSVCVYFKVGLYKDSINLLISKFITEVNENFDCMQIFGDRIVLFIFGGNTEYP